MNPYPLEPSNDLGGIGLWTTPRDFNLFLWNLFLKSNGLLTPENLRLILEPQVSDTKLVSESIHGSNAGILTRTFPEKLPLDFGLGACITARDIPGRRPKGSVSWLGYPNEYWVCTSTPPRRIITLSYLNYSGLIRNTKSVVSSTCN